VSHSGGTAAALEIDLGIAPGEFLRLYRGEAGEVLARARDGRLVRFPAAALRPWVGHDGVHGRFRLSFDAAFRLRAIERIDAVKLPEGACRA